MSTGARSWKARVPLVLALVVGFISWKSGFGFYATERTLVIRMPVSYADVRSVEVQVWKDDALLKREQSHFPAGVTNELQIVLPMVRGEHRAIVSADLTSAGTKTWVKDFDPEGESTRVLELK